MKNLFLLLLFFLPTLLYSQPNLFEPINVFDLEYASDPQIAPDGQSIIYVRNFKDIMTDANRSNLWTINTDGTEHRPLTTGMENDRSPRWSPDGKKLVYLSAKEDRTQLYLHWMDNGMESRLSNLASSPNGVTWSPNGKWLAFSMFVPSTKKPLVSMPAKPAGAKWNSPPVYVDKMKFKSDGNSTILPDGYQHLFIISTEGGTPRQITQGDFNYSGTISWSPDNLHLLVSANRKEDREMAPNDTEIHQVDIATGTIKTLTNRKGPDQVAGYSPNGKWIAYTGYTDEYLGFQIAELSIMRSDGSESRSLTSQLDRSVGGVTWAKDGKGLYFQYSDKGNSKVAYVNLSGKVSIKAHDLGGLSIGRPYSGGQFSVADNNRIAFTHSRPDHPADIAVDNGNTSRRLTNLNDDLFSYKQLGQVEEIWYASSYDQQQIQGWICKPPNFDSTKKYPLLLEIHGGPFADYGDRFSAEVQLYAAAGYVVLYTNPRGSSSYGKKFGNLIHHDYPNHDYDDLITGVDQVIAKGYIDTDQLYVTGGSGGGVLTSWIVGKTDRFRAAVVAKPVINWYSFVLHADNPAFFAKYWFGGYPWEEGQAEKYIKRSPLSLVGNVTTPTMLLTGEQDYRTPMSESEQYYAALQLEGVESALVRIQNSGHGIANTPSNLIAKVVYVLGWFEKHK